jgi:hypothetical protein
MLFPSDRSIASKAALRHVAASMREWVASGLGNRRLSTHRQRICPNLVAEGEGKRRMLTDQGVQWITNVWQPVRRFDHAAFP